MLKRKILAQTVDAAMITCFHPTTAYARDRESIVYLDEPLKTRDKRVANCNECASHACICRPCMLWCLRKKRFNILTKEPYCKTEFFYITTRVLLNTELNVWIGQLVKIKNWTAYDHALYYNLSWANVLSNARHKSIAVPDNWWRLDVHI